MKKNAGPIVVLGLLCAGYLIFIAGSTSLLPERVAIHFGGGGEANGWMSRSADLVFFGGLGVGCLVFIVLSLVTGLMPARFVTSRTASIGCRRNAGRRPAPISRAR